MNHPNKRNHWNDFDFPTQLKREPLLILTNVVHRVLVSLSYSELFSIHCSVTTDLNKKQMVT